MLTNILSLCGALILPWPLMPQNGQVKNNEVRKPKYGNRSTEVSRKAAYHCLLPWDLLLSQHLVPPMWSNPYSCSEFCFANLTESSVIMSYHKALEAQESVVTRCRGQHRQHSEPGQTLRQAGNKPESTLTSQVQYRACYRPLENYLSNAAYIWA